MSEHGERAATIYLAGPISLNGTCTPDEVAAFKEVFAHEAAKLRRDGLTVLNPCELTERPTWADYMRATIPMVCEADAVVALPRWQESRGARIELALAKELSIPVYTDTQLAARLAD